MTPDAVALRPDVTATVAALTSGDVFVELVADTAEQRAAGLQTVLAAVADEGTRVAWVGNPLRSALTIERFLLQLIGPELDLRIERGPADLARLIATRREAERRLLIVVQQPETIDPETLEQLGALAGYLDGEAMEVQFLLVGSPALRLPRIARPEIGRLLLLPRDPAVSPAPMASEESSVPEMSGTRRRDVLPLLLLLLVISLGAVFSLARPAPGDEPGAAVVPSAAPPAAVVRIDDTDKLRRQFDAFLAERAATLPALSEDQKDKLFTEFLTRHTRE